MGIMQVWECNIWYSECRMGVLVERSAISPQDILYRFLTGSWTSGSRERSSFIPDAKDDDERAANDRRHHTSRGKSFNSELNRVLPKKGDRGVTRDPAGRLAEALERQRLHDWGALRKLKYIS